MNIRSAHLPWLFMALFPFSHPKASESANSAKSLFKKNSLNKTELYRAYRESEWESVQKQLETYLSEKGDSNVNRDERILAYKYLGVIYGADTLTRARSESYFNRLLELSPTIDIVDLYPSPRISKYFGEIKKERNQRIEYTQGHDEFGNEISPISKQVPTHQPEIKADKNSGMKWVWWTVGTAAVVGSAFGIYEWTHQNKVPDEISRTLTFNGNTDQP